MEQFIGIKNIEDLVYKYATSNSISVDNIECLKMMQGCEINSLHYEGVVGIRKYDVIRDGKVIDTLNSNKKIETLWDEYIMEEGLF